MTKQGVEQSLRNQDLLKDGEVEFDFLVDIVVNGELLNLLGVWTILIPEGRPSEKFERKGSLQGAARIG